MSVKDQSFEYCWSTVGMANNYSQGRFLSKKVPCRVQVGIGLSEMNIIERSVNNHRIKLRL